MEHSFVEGDMHTLDGEAGDICRETPGPVRIADCRHLGHKALAEQLDVYEPERQSRTSEDDGAPIALGCICDVRLINLQEISPTWQMPL
jgi:hypothetical protein